MAHFDVNIKKHVLKFTYEIGYNNLAFLDVNVKIHNERFQTSVHIKPTNSGNLLNYLSECPDKYKIGVITTLLHRARKICSDSTLLLCEVDRIKQLFINNNYPMSAINDSMKTYLEKFRDLKNLKEKKSEKKKI